MHTCTTTQLHQKKLYQLIKTLSCIFRLEYRQRGRFAGFSLYVSYTGDLEGSTLCYKDGHQLPPLNFTTTCTEYGRYVIFYNERKAGVVYPDGYQLSNMYTELCEVIVKGIYNNAYGNQTDNLVQCIVVPAKYSDTGFEN